MPDTEDVQADVQATVRGFIVEALGTDDLDDDVDLFERGYVNSLFALELVTFVEKRFGLAVEAEDLDLDNFRSIACLTGFVQKKRADTAADAS